MLLYPPTIEGQLPPAVLWVDKNQNQIITFTIPYQINNGTNPLAIKGYRVKIKNLISDQLLITQDVEGKASDCLSFNIDPSKLAANLGDQLKIQVAFKESEEIVGYFSTVGICKLIAQPELKLSLSNKVWSGVYINSQSDELLYTSQFILKDDLGQIIEEGELETVNYLDSIADEEFYQSYFEQVVYPELNDEKNKALKGQEDFNTWYNTIEENTEYLRKIHINQIALQRATKPSEYGEEDNAELAKHSLFSPTLISEFKEINNQAKKLLENQNYDNLLIKPMLDKIEPLNTKINELNNNGVARSENQQQYIENIINEVSNLIVIYQTLFLKHEANMKNRAEYWTNQFNSNFSTYYNSVRKSGKVCSYQFKADLKVGYKYIVEWKIKTSSGYEGSISEEAIANTDILQPDYVLIPVVHFNENSGCAELAVKENGEATIAAEANYGRWVITKASSKDNFASWEELTTIDNFYSWYLSPEDNEFKNILIKDYNIEHGYSYKYAMQQINDHNLYSTKILTSVIVAKFEDVFLCDETRQLKLAFNPKVSSMKNNILEAKQDTIGGQHPFIFRNNQVKYKDFSLSGLISYLQDPDNEFKVEFGDYKNTNTTNLTDENIAKERIFKLEVLDWLNNGKTKLLKSPTEGNYQVRIMNVSMSPNDTLGRMLHNFTATAIEVKDKNFKVKVDLNFTGKELVHVATIGATSEFTWSDKIIKSLWVYGDTLAPDVIATINIPENGNTKSYQVTQAGLRIEYPNGIKITGESPGLAGLTTDVYYILDPRLIPKDFSEKTSCELTEQIGCRQGASQISGQNYYKTLIAKYNANPPAGFNPEDTSRQVWITDASGAKQIYKVVDQLQLEDIQINLIEWGENIQLTYCYVSPKIK